MSVVSRHLRPRDGAAQAVSAVELFFDLVYVFAVTELSHLVIDGHLRSTSIVRAAFLLVVVWWAWIYTTWMINWFDPASVRVRLVMVAAALVSLLMSAAIPTAFGADAILFAGAYVALQAGRNLAGMAMLARDEPLRPVFERLVAWSVLSGVFWILGALLGSGVRDELWTVALVIDLAGPFAGYRTPFLGASGTSDWNVEGSHFAERVQGFIIIALGESIVVTGASASGDGLDLRTGTVLALAFAVTGVLWWLYFDDVAERSREDIAGRDDPGRYARDAFTYLHLPIVAGVIMVAVADDVLVPHPGLAFSGAAVVMALGGPALYLLGEAAARLRMVGRVSRARLGAVLALGALGLVGHDWAAWVLVVVELAVLAGLAGYESPLGTPLRDRLRNR